MLLYLVSIITLAVFTPLAADDCQCQFTGMSGKVSIYTYREDGGSVVAREALRPFLPNFEVDFKLGQAWFYPNRLGNNSVYIQDLKTNTMYIYPHENGRPTGTCKNVTMPKGLILQSCIPASSTTISSSREGQLLIRPKHPGGISYNYYVDANDPCKVIDLHQYHDREGLPSITLFLRVVVNNLDFTNRTTRFKLETDSCQEEDLNNLFYEK